MRGPSFEQTWISFTQGCFVQAWLKLGQWFSRRCHAIRFYFFPIIFHGKGHGFSVEETWTPSPMDVLCQVCLKLIQWMRCEKFTDRQIDGRTYDKRKKKLTWAFGELIKVKISGSGNDPHNVRFNQFILIPVWVVPTNRVWACRWSDEISIKIINMAGGVKVILYVIKCKLKLKTIHKCFLCPYKRQISMLRFIALRGVRAHRNVAHLQHR